MRIGVLTPKQTPPEKIEKAFLGPNPRYLQNVGRLVIFRNLLEQNINKLQREARALLDITLRILTPPMEDFRVV